MFESRCGIKCDSCTGKEEAKCTGCTNMEKPFWGGECGVKSCCETKQLDHCGICSDFPCEMVATMGKEQGYDSAPRLDNLQKWTKG